MLTTMWWVQIAKIDSMDKGCGHLKSLDKKCLECLKNVQKCPMHLEV
jgi:hypothetical protein